MSSSVDALHRCPDCDMMFTSQGQMRNHRARFCVGLDSGPHRSYIPEPSYRQTSHSYHRITPQFDRRTERDRLARETDDWAQLPAFISGKNSRHIDPQERSMPPPVQKPIPQALARQRPTLRGWSPAAPPSTVSSMTIDLPSSEEESTTPRPVMSQQREQQLRRQMEDASRNLSHYKSKASSLHRQKHDIDRRLNEITQGPDLHDSSVLDQLRFQQRKNSITRKHVKDSMNAMRHNRPLSPDKVLLQEISNMRTMYIRNGGNNRQILAEISAMEREALDVAEKTMKHSAMEQQEKEKLSALSEQLVALELENERIHDELLSMHETNNDRMAQSFLSRSDHHGTREDPFNREFASRRQRYLSELEALELDIELLNERKLNGVRRKVEAT